MYHAWYSELQIGWQGLELVLIRTTPHNLIMATNTDRYLELDSTAGDEGLLGQGILVWFRQDPLCGSFIRGMADTSTESQGVRVQILAWSSTA